MSRVKIGLVGYGGWGKRHFETLRANPRVSLSGVFDPKYKGPGFLSPFDELVQRSEALDVVVPPRFLVHVAERALRAGRHVFVEKPMAVNYKEGSRLRKYAESRKVMVGFIERFNPVFNALRVILQAEKPAHVFCQRSGTPTLVATETGAMKDLAIHDLDLLCWMLGRPKAVTGSTYHDSKMAQLHLEFDSTEATIVADCLGPLKVRRWVVETRDGTITAVFEDQRWRLYRGNKELRVPWMLPLSVELGQFVRSIATDSIPSPSVDDGLRALRIVESIK
jgi:predicted dehydrogenase